MDQLNKGDYANGDPVEVVYYIKSKTYSYQARSHLVNQDEGQILHGRKAFPVPKLKRKMVIKINAEDWAGDAVHEELELPKRVWAGRNSGVMFRALFVDPGDEFAGVASGGGVAASKPGEKA